MPQSRHPRPPFARLNTRVSHSRWQFEHRHQTFVSLPGSTSAGVTSPFKVGCHSAASGGMRSASDCPGGGFLITTEIVLHRTDT